MEIIYNVKNLSDDQDGEKMNYVITEKKYSNDIINKIYGNYYDKFMSIKISSKQNKNIKYLKDSIKFFSITKYDKYPLSSYLSEILNLGNFIYYDYYNKKFLEIKKQEINNSDKKTYVFDKKTYDNYNTGNNNVFNHLKSCKYSHLLYQICIKWLKYIFNILKKNDNTLFYLDSLYCGYATMNLCYLLPLIFDKFLILDARSAICLGFNSESPYIKYILEFDEMQDKYLDIEPKPELDKLKEYIHYRLKYQLELYELILNKEEDKLFNELFKFYSSFAKDSIIKEYDREGIFHQYLQKFFIEHTRRFFYTNKNSKNGNVKELKIHSAIKKEEGNNIQKVIKKYKLKKCLEIGMAFGISAFYILTTNKNISLMSIDPFQRDEKQWNSMGLKLIEQMNLEERHHFLEEVSYISLPKLLSTYGPSYFDFIFIDGWHTFDYTLLDFFYADKLLRVDGVILIDDALHEGVKKFVKYIDNNYKNYDKIQTEKTQAGYIKKYEDTREWFFHKEF